MRTPDRAATGAGAPERDARALPELAPLIAELRGAEPRARAFLVFGSFARGDAGPYSDVDLRVITAGEPVERDRVRFLGGEAGPLVHVSIGTRSFAELAALLQKPDEWPWTAGILARAQVLDDPDDLVGTLRRLVETHRPARLATAAGVHYDLETLLEAISKCKNAQAAGSEGELFVSARHVAECAVVLLLALNEVVPALGRRAWRVRARALPVAPPGYAADVALCAGDTGQARASAEVFAAAMRLGEGTLRLLMERQAGLPLDGALARYLRDGTLLRYVRQRA
jgi:hypothetical protein